MASPNGLTSEYDIIFAGGGTVACVVAGRLADADPNLKILVIEAGPHTRRLQEHIRPALFPGNLTLTSKVLTFHVSQPSDALLGRSVVVPAGKCVGGGSSVNFMMYTRAAASDYDEWESVYGNEGWGSKDLIPLLNKVETYEADGNQAMHGHSGPIKVSSGGVCLEPGKQFLAVASAYDKGRGKTEDTNDFHTVNAYGRWAKYIDAKSGRRSDAAHHFIYNQDNENKNLHVLSNTAVVRVLIQDKRAVGVEYTDASTPGSDSDVIRAYASKLVVVSAGAFGSPALLQRSGIGAKDLLEKLDIKQEVDLPGVGENYLDHNATFTPYFVSDLTITLDTLGLISKAELQSYVEQWERNGDGLIATNGIDAGIKVRPDADDLRELGPNFERVWKRKFENAPDKPIMWIGPLSNYVGEDTTIPKRAYMSMCAYTEYPVSTGRVHIMSPDWRKPLHFEPGYLNDPADLDILRWGYKKARELARRMPLYRGELPQGHPAFAPDSDAVCKERSGPVDISAPDIQYTAQDDDVLNEYIRKNVHTTWHSMGTCAMKPRDQGGVVDPKLNVYGILNLKVADLSISPGNVSANTYNTALGVGEKAALIIAEGFGIKL